MAASRAIKAMSNKKRPAAEAEASNRVSSKRVKTTAVGDVEAKSARGSHQAVSPEKKQEERVITGAPTGTLQVYVFGEGSAGELCLGSKNATEITVPRLHSNLAGVVCLACGGIHQIDRKENYPRSEILLGRCWRAILGAGRILVAQGESQWQHVSIRDKDRKSPTGTSTNSAGCLI